MMKTFLFALLSLASLGAAAADAKQATLDPKVPCAIDYPKTSLLNEERGTVVMSLLISAEGKVLESKVTKSSGHKNLDKTAATSILKCKFLPSASGQQWQGMEYVWKLD